MIQPIHAKKLDKVLLNSRLADCTIRGVKSYVGAKAAVIMTNGGEAATKKMNNLYQGEVAKFVDSHIAEVSAVVRENLSAMKKVIEPDLCIPSFKGPDRSEYINKYAQMRPGDTDLQIYKNIFNYFA